MGQSPLKGVPVSTNQSIQIQLPKKSFTSNESIKGTVNINLERPFQGQFLQLTLYGIEEIHFNYGAFAEGHKTRTILYVNEINRFLKFSIPLYDFSNGSNSSNFIIQPRQAVIPFQLDVAQVLPSSLTYKLDQYNYCSIKYILQAELLPSQAQEEPISSFQNIAIKQIVSTEDYPKQADAIQSPSICFGLCCGTGKIKYKMTTDSRSFSPGEQLHVNFDIDISQFKKKILHFNVQFQGRLFMNSKKDQEQKQFINHFESKDIKPISLKTQNSTSINLPIQFQIPEGINLTSNGFLFNQEYNIIVVPIIDSFWYVSDDAAVGVEIFINPKLSQNRDQQIPPLEQLSCFKNWSPVELQPTQFNKFQMLNYQLHKQNFFSQQEFNVNKELQVQGMHTVSNFIDNQDYEQKMLKENMKQLDQGQNNTQQQIETKQKLETQQQLNTIQQFETQGIQLDIQPMMQNQNQRQCR